MILIPPSLQPISSCLRLHHMPRSLRNLFNKFLVVLLLLILYLHLNLCLAPLRHKSQVMSLRKRIVWFNRMPLLKLKVFLTLQSLWIKDLQTGLKTHGSKWAGSNSSYNYKKKIMINYSLQNQFGNFVEYKFILRLIIILSVPTTRPLSVPKGQGLKIKVK